MSVQLSALITRGQQLADMVNTNFVDTATWTQWANDGQEELFQLVSSQFKDTFFQTYDFSLTSGVGNNAVSLPANFRRLRGLDLNPTLAPPARRAVLKFNFSERNFSRGVYLRPVAPDRRYRVVSRAVMLIEPPEACGGNYRLYYVQGPATLVNPTDTLMTELEPWAEYVALVMARKALLKEESDISGVDERIAQMRADVAEAVETDDGEADSVADVEEGDGFGLGLFGVRQWRPARTSRA